MHSEIIQSSPGSCPICGMSLEIMNETGVSDDMSELKEMSFRFWGGATVEKADIESALEWLDWGYRTVRAQYQQEAA